MSFYSQTLSQENKNLLRNTFIKFEICPLVYQTIIEWGFEKPDGVKIIDHFKVKNIEEKCSKDLKKWIHKYKTLLKATDFSSFDVTFLHDLLPVLCCDKVSQTGTKDWEVKVKDTKSIEYLLYEIKKFRNELSHSYRVLKADPKIEKMNLLRKCIRTAGKLYSKDKSEINEKIENLQDKFDEFVHETFTYLNVVQKVARLIQTESAPFWLEKYSRLFYIPLPGGLGHVGTTQSVNLSVDIEEKDDINADKKSVFSSTRICSQVKNKFVVIKGGPGSGKTTLLRNLYQNILHNLVRRNESSYKSIDRFGVPIYLECRTEQQNNLSDFLKESVPNFHSSSEIIHDAFKECAMEGKVFLIDGYDEVNDDSRKLVDQIIAFCSKYYATCIVTSRVDAANNFITNLENRNLSYDEMLIEPISKMSDKLSLLMWFGDKMGDDVDSEELVNSFENLNEASQEVFFSPLLLALYIFLFLNNRNCLSQLHNEQSAYKAIREIFYTEIGKKLRESDVSNPKTTTEDIFAVFSYYSLLLFNNEEYFFEKHEYFNLIRDCQQKISKDVDFEKLFSCILTPETSLKQGKAITYAFTHNKIQEYLAVEQITKNMEKSKIDWNSVQLSEGSLREQFFDCFGVYTLLSDVKKEAERYGNVIKLLILEILSDGELPKYTKTFTAVLKEYFGNDKYYLIELVTSSNCDSAIVSIVSDFQRDESSYELESTRHIRPITELLKKNETSTDIEFDFSESLTDTDCTNLGQLVSVLKEDSLISLNCNRSYDNYQPLNGEFYTQLSNSKCKLTKFTACVTSDEHLSIVKKVYRGGYRNTLCLSFKSVFDVSFAILEGHEEIIYLKVRYTEKYCPSTDSNPVPSKTELYIENIPADGKDNSYRMINILSPKSKLLWSINLDKCHMTDADANELLNKLERKKLRSRWGERIEVKKMRVNEDESRNLELCLPDIEKREAEQREPVRREAAQREAAQRQAAQRDVAQREAAQREAAQRQAAQRDIAEREAAQREAAQRDVAQREAAQLVEEMRKVAQLEAELREAVQREVEQLVEERQEVAQLEAKLREAELRETVQREAALREAKQLETEKQKIAHLEDKLRVVELREAVKREAAQREVEQRKATQRETKQQETEQREAVYLWIKAIMGGIICLIICAVFWNLFERF